INGDTTEYHALSFQSNANDKVENLLKQLPGISVDKDGKLSAQSQTIDKVLVDGQEFFGDDPTLATRNIRTDMVDKIQVFEKKSDLATLVGRNDGKGIRTINIKLKADKKKGYFGKTEAGMGTGDFHAAQLMGDYFNGQQRISVYRVAGNNGATSLN
ncbi:TonB-dependent receptor, partial [Micromonospora chalcea]